MATLKVEVPENSQNLVGVSTIKAPIAKVFEAYTNIELFKQWWSRGNEMKVYTFNPVSGGSWHIAEQSNGGEWEFFGTFHEIAKNERIIQTFEFLGMPERGHVGLQAAHFKAIDETTTEITEIHTAQSVEDRDGMVESGMEDGWRQSVESLGKLLENK